MHIPSEHIRTLEVFDWGGVHLLHYSMSSCSQKVRILLGEKGIPWTSHPIDLAKGEHTTPWFLGINSRGVVPVLVHDGEVYNESNDILVYLDGNFPSSQGSYMPQTDEERERAQSLMSLEDDLHDDLRIITFTFVVPGRLMKKSTEEIQAYTRNGQPDSYRSRQIEWWKRFSASGIEDAEIMDAISRFHQVFLELDERLGKTRYLCGDRVMLPDIAWFITIHRLVLAGYPINRLSRLSAYYRNLLSRPAFQQEASSGPWLARVVGSLYRKLNLFNGPPIRERLDGMTTNVAS